MCRRGPWWANRPWPCTASSCHEARSRGREAIPGCDQRREPVILIERVCRCARTGLLAKAEINSAYNFALFVEVLKRLFHLAVEHHPSINVDALLLAQIFGVADGRGGPTKVARPFVATLVAFTSLADGEARLFKTIIRNRIGALLGKNL